jgi:hypothetical protein
MINKEKETMTMRTMEITCKKNNEVVATYEADTKTDALNQFADDSGLQCIAGWEYAYGVDMDTVFDVAFACEHESVTTPDGNGAYCKHCGETIA